MWIIVASLLLVPLAVGIVILGRVLGGNPALTDRERRLFGDSEDKTLPIWMWLQFAGIMMIFFVLGFLEGIVLINLGPVWMVLAPLVTGIGAMLILMLWLQDRKESLVARPHPHRFGARHPRNPSAKREN
ncbi:MAG TPA: hypothetical protein VFU31_28080 [Candidatus Binatia bacterium]|nr:hypothetical protein [Candidatus Binatia bacterium]